MDSFELNKIAGAVLGTLLFVVALGIIAGGLYHTGHPEQPGIEIAGVAESGGPAAPQIEPIAVRLASANPDRGKALAGQCAGCHTLEKGQAHAIGPNLWGVVGGPMAHEADFDYSESMREHAAQGGTWTFENLDTFITKPQAFIPNTKMGFPGLANPQSRADVIAYLNNQSDSPLPLPEVSADVGADQGAAPAEGTAAPAGGAAAPAEGAAAPAETPAPAAPETAPAPAENAAPAQ
jgi:cytochrome c